MIHRFVKMYFSESSAKEFVQIFEQSVEKIKKFQGCHQVILLKDVNDENVMMTYSIWEKDEDLQCYRNSDFFKNTWNKTKLLFIQKADAWSMMDYKANENSKIE